MPTSVPFLALKDAALGPNYDLSLVFVDPKESQRLNALHRGKDRPANILSFPLTDTSGEIFIDLKTSRGQAPDFDQEFENFIAFLFVHGLYHLKGFDHGAIMERKERALCKHFNIARGMSH